MSLIEFAAVFSLGVAASSNPCVLPLYPGFLAYLGKAGKFTGRVSEYLLGLFVLLGVTSSMLTIGAVITIARVSALSVLRYATPVVDIFLIALGAVLISGRQPWARLRPPSLPKVSNPVLQAYIYGALYGPITLPCNLPLLLSAVGFSVSAADLLGGITTFVTFALGFGLPLIVLSVAASGQRKWLLRNLIARHKLINVAAGAILIGIGVYDLVLVSQLISISF